MSGNRENESLRSQGTGRRGRDRVEKQGRRTHGKVRLNFVLDREDRTSGSTGWEGLMTGGRDS